MLSRCDSWITADSTTDYLPARSLSEEIWYLHTQSEDKVRQAQ